MKTLALKRRTLEEKTHDRLGAEKRRRADQIKKEREAFFKTPAGQARVAYQRGDHVFQYQVEVMNQKAIIVAMVGSTTSHKTVDPVWVLNSVCHEGWELVNGSFVFVEQGQQSRDKFLKSGQNVAIKGATVGYYLFQRCEANRRTGDASAPAQPGPGCSLDGARALFERGEIIDAAEVMYQLSAVAQDSRDRRAIEEVEDTIRQMRELLAGAELLDFDDGLRQGSG